MKTLLNILSWILCGLTVLKSLDCFITNTTIEQHYYELDHRYYVFNFRQQYTIHGAEISFRIAHTVGNENYVVEPIFVGIFEDNPSITIVQNDSLIFNASYYAPRVTVNKNTFRVQVTIEEPGKYRIRGYNEWEHYPLSDKR
jgi:hypothetical protein